MKVLQIVPQMNIGGVERGVLDLAKFFKSPDKGVENIVISGGGRLVPELKTLGIKHYRLAVYRKSFFSLFLILRIRKIIHDEHIDIVHARSRVPGWLGFFASRGSRSTGWRPRIQHKKPARRQGLAPAPRPGRHCGCSG